MKINIANNEVVHFIGIGGIGMSGLAQIMNNMGFTIQGSDSNRNKNTDRLIKIGIKVYKPSDFGRRLINTAKQHLHQKIKDVEKQVIYDEYDSKIGEIVMGYILKIMKLIKNIPYLINFGQDINAES